MSTDVTDMTTVTIVDNDGSLVLQKRWHAGPIKEARLSSRAAYFDIWRSGEGDKKRK